MDNAADEDIFKALCGWKYYSVSIDTTHTRVRKISDISVGDILLHEYEVPRVGTYWAFQVTRVTDKRVFISVPTMLENGVVVYEDMCLTWNAKHNWLENQKKHFLASKYLPYPTYIRLVAEDEATRV